ncbi:MAG: hypothetical protein IJX41_04800 [Bacteroidaceae bacterium]|nr:hypothetical protein [Bacteroidaceae bacterium]
MDIIIGIVIVAVVYIFSNIRKLSSTDAEESTLPRGVMGEPFPTVEPWEMEPQPFTEQHPVTPKSKGKSRKKKSVQATIIAPPVDTAAQPANEDVSASKKESFAIKTKSDAKRAIIYSEIFNRKYN